MRNPLILLYLFFSIAIIQSSCKEKNKNITPPTCGSSTTYDHFYKVYSGVLYGVSGGPISSIFGECKFNNQSKFYLYFKNTSTAAQVGRVDSMHYYYLIMNESNKPGIRKRRDSIYLLLKNYSKTSGHIDSNKDTFGIDAPKHLGSLGCFPKFLTKSDGKLEPFTYENNLYITLPFVRHKNGNVIYDTLTGYDFKISENELMRLNDSLAVHPDLQGGIDADKLNKLIVYKPNDVFLDCFGEK